MYTKQTLKNGLRFIHYPLHETKSVTILVLFLVGSRYETPELSGVSHFIEHLMFKGTARRKDTLSLSKELDSVGAEYNAFTSKDYTGYYVKINYEKFELALDVLSDILFYSKFDPKEMEREKLVIIEEIKMYRENPIMHLEGFFEELVYLGSTLGWNIAGTPESMRGMEREAVLSFKQEYYQPQRAVVAISGNAPTEQVFPLVERYFVDQFPRTNRKQRSFKKFSSRQMKPRLEIDERDVEQVQLGLGFPSYSYSDERLSALRLLSIILGGNMSSRLFIRVREKFGLAYAISASTNVYEDTGNFLIHAGLDTKRLNKAVDVIAQELARVKEKGVTEEELRRAKDYIEGKFVLSFEDTEALAQWYAKQELLTGKTLTPEQEFQRLNKVNKNDVRAVAQDIFRNNMISIAIIGRVKDSEKLLRRFSF